MGHSQATACVRVVEPTVLRWNALVVEPIVPLTERTEAGRILQRRITK